MIEAELPDGRILEFPEGTSPDVIQKTVKGMLTPQEQPKPQPSKLKSFGAGLGSGVGNIVLGAQNLAGMGLEKLGAETVGEWLQEDARKGKEKLRAEVAPFKAANPLITGGAELAGEIISTLPVGAGLARGVSMIPGASTRAAPLVESLRSWGMRTGQAAPQTMAQGAQQIGTRVAGGAATGGTAAAMINPEDAGTGAVIGGAIPLAGPVIRGTGRVGSVMVGGMTGAGDEAIKQAYRAGRVGGDTAETFTRNLRGNADMAEVLVDAKANLAAMNQAKQAAYRADMNALKTDKTVLAFDGIDDSVKDALSKVTFKGQVKNEGAANFLQKAQAEIDNWKNLDPQEFHTPEGLDALKQKVGDILESIPFEQKTARAAVGEVYNGIKNEIKKQAPKYADTMKAYQEASELTREIERALSLNPAASVDTSMRKLQSLMRNNAATNYGNRLDLASQLEAAGGREMMPALAGQQLNTWTPRSLQSLAASSPAMIGSFAFGGMPGVIANAALTSPRIAGEAAYGLGRMARPNEMVNALRSGVTRAAPLLAAEPDQ